VRDRRAAAALAVLAVLSATGCAGRSASQSQAPVADVKVDDADGLNGVLLPRPYRVPDVALEDTAGKQVALATAARKPVTLVFFGYTHCPDVCPTTMADIALAMRKVDPAVAAQTSVVFVTTDPARDTPEVLGAYLDQFDTDLPTQFIGLTGDQGQIDQAQLAAGVPQAEDMGQTHSALLLLYGTDGEADVAFDAENTGADIAHDLAVVAAE
jgi:protein SCO1